MSSPLSSPTPSNPNNNIIGDQPVCSPPSLSSVPPSSSSSSSFVYPATADGYDVYEEIGSGAFASVYRGMVRENGEEIAIKMIDLDEFQTNWDEIRREIMIMSLLNHPNVVKIKCSFVDGADLWIVMSYLHAGSCAHIMKQIAPNGFKDEILIATILREVLNGLQYFHKDGRIHRDVKAGNILLGKDGEVQLADFGVAGTMMEAGDRKKNRKTFTGTPCWMAPEVMEQTAGHDEKADIWSVGITAMELGYGRAPYAKFPAMKVMLLTLQEDSPTCDVYHDTSYKFSKHYHSFIEKCLDKNPKKRPSAKKLLEHKFFRIAKDSDYIVQQIIRVLPATSIDEHAPKYRRGEKRINKHQNADNNNAAVELGDWVFEDEKVTSTQNNRTNEREEDEEDEEEEEEEEEDENANQSVPAPVTVRKQTGRFLVEESIDDAANSIGANSSISPSNVSNNNSLHSNSHSQSELISPIIALSSSLPAPITNHSNLESKNTNSPAIDDILSFGTYVEQPTNPSFQSNNQDLLSFYGMPDIVTSSEQNTTTASTTASTTTSSNVVGRFQVTNG